MFITDPEERKKLWMEAVTAVEYYYSQLPALPVTGSLNGEEIRSEIARFRFDKPIDRERVFDFVSRCFVTYNTHTISPKYFGLFDPAPASIAVAAEFLAAAINPQLSSWAQSPFAVEVERHLIRTFGQLFGYPESDSDGTFTSGGMEANHTAILTALARKFPAFPDEGVQGIPDQPILYASTESHHSIVKAARLCGLGDRAVHRIPVDRSLKMEVGSLRRQIEIDRGFGCSPFMLVGTAGATSSGAIDPLEDLAAVARSNDLWYHVDVAWGGAVAFSRRHRALLSGINQADSITIDPHKWLGIPRGVGTFLTRDKTIMNRTFAVRTAYMPRIPDDLARDPFCHSMTWSRRFSGLLVFFVMAVAGIEGYEAMVDRQMELGDYLRSELDIAGWEILNDSPLPVVCFTGKGVRASGKAYLEAIRDSVVASGEAWISITLLDARVPALRACITNSSTAKEDVDRLINALKLSSY